MAKSDPFSPLVNGEFTVLRGGFGGGAKWVWGGFMGLTFAALLVTSAVMLVKGDAKQADLVSMSVILPLLGAATIVPWLRSGRFLLTNRRLAFKSTLGSLREVPLTQIGSIDEVNPNTGSLRLILAGGEKLKMRNLGGWKKLWSGLLLYRLELMQRPLPAVMGQVSHLAYRAPRQQGRTGLQNGTMVFRPHRAWYLPDSAVLNLIGEAIGNMFKGQHTVQPELPTLEHINRLSQAAPEEFDERVDALCEALGGIAFAPGEVQVSRKKMALRGSHDVVRVSAAQGVIQKGVRRPEIEALDWFDRWIQA